MVGTTCQASLSLQSHLSSTVTTSFQTPSKLPETNPTGCRYGCAGRTSPALVDNAKQQQPRTEVPGGKTLPLGGRPRAVPVEGQAQPQAGGEAVRPATKSPPPPAAAPVAGSFPASIARWLFLEGGDGEG